MPDTQGCIVCLMVTLARHADAQRDAEHARDHEAEREFERADPDVMLQLARRGEVPHRGHDLRRRGKEKRIVDDDAAEKFPEGEAADDRQRYRRTAARKRAWTAASCGGRQRDWF